MPALADPFVHTKKTTFMQRVADAVSRGHTRYASGSVPLAKVRNLATKFTKLYDINLPKTAACRARKKGYATTRFLCWLMPDNEQIVWVLLATQGDFAVGQDLDKWLDPASPKSRILLTGYELLQLTKPEHKKPVWTWRYTRERHDELREQVVVAIRHKNDMELHQLIDAIWRTPGFSGSRDQAKKFRALITVEWERSRNKGESKPRIPARLGYVRRLKDRGKKASVLMRPSNRQTVQAGN